MKHLGAGHTRGTVGFQDPYCRAPGKDRSYPSLVPVNQYTYFALSSRDTSAAEMAAILGIEENDILGVSPRQAPG